MIEDLEDHSNQEISYKQTKNIIINHKPTQKTSFQQTLTIYSMINSHKQCRICLQDETNPQNPLISPCKCIGSVQNIHNDCLLKWLLKKYEQKSNQQRKKAQTSGIECEMCKDKIYPVPTIQYNISTKQQLFQKIQQKLLPSITFFFFMIVNIAILIFLIVYMKQSLDLKKSLVLGLIVLITFMLLSVSLTISVYYVIKELVIVKKIVIREFSSSGIQSIKGGMSHCVIVDLIE